MVVAEGRTPRFRALRWSGRADPHWFDQLQALVVTRPREAKLGYFRMRSHPGAMRVTPSLGSVNTERLCELARDGIGGGNLEAVG